MMHRKILLLFVSAVTAAGMGSTAKSSRSPKLFVALFYTASIELLTKSGQGGRIPDPSLTPECGGHMVLRKDKVEIGNSGYNASRSLGQIGNLG
jgi:hypothetical protein